ncbi:MAG: hypothetical protein KGL39_55730 [Patescibacteria group bacterium]|nr:hypothetical protein [Patescibacteria group bacterium]
MLKSDYKPLCPVALPFQNRQKYMHSFDLANPVMADGYEDYLEPVMALCKAAGAVKGIAHMTVDEKIVEAGMSQRRPKPHVDGCFMPEFNWWGHEGPGWLHTCNEIGSGAYARMSVIVAASVSGCKAWRGDFDGQPKSDGDLSHIEDQLGNGEVLPPGVGYLLSPDCVHESMVFDKPTQRSFLRIALPVDFKFNESDIQETANFVEGGDTGG